MLSLHNKCNIYILPVNIFLSDIWPLQLFLLCRTSAVLKCHQQSQSQFCCFLQICISPLQLIFDYWTTAASTLHDVKHFFSSKTTRLPSRRSMLLTGCKCLLARLASDEVIHVIKMIICLWSEADVSKQQSYTELYTATAQSSK